jgi:predicted MFS family arabinose efflux permease
MADNAETHSNAPHPMMSERARERIILLVLAAVQFTNIVDFMVVMPLGPTLMDTLKINPRQFSLIVSSYTFSASIAGLLAAFFVDRFDRKTTFLTLYAGFLVGNLSCAFAGGYFPLLCARVFTGAFGGILGGMALAIVGDVFPESRRGSATGVLMSAFAVASVIGVPFGLKLGSDFGWNAPFLFVAGLAVPVLILGVIFLPSIRGHLDHESAGTALEKMWGVLSHPNHLRAFALVVAMMVGSFAVISFIATYLVDNVGVPNDRLPWVYVGGGALTLFAAPVIGKLADRFGKLHVYRVIAPITVVLMIVVTNLRPVSFLVAVAVVSVLMVSNAGRMVAAMAMITACVESRRRGSFMSINASVQHLSAGLGAFLAGLMLDRAEDGSLIGYPRVGILAVAATLLSILLAGRLRPATPTASPSDPGADDETTEHQAEEMQAAAFETA